MRVVPEGYPSIKSQYLTDLAHTVKTRASPQQTLMHQGTKRANLLSILTTFQYTQTHTQPSPKSTHKYSISYLPIVKSERDLPKYHNRSASAMDYACGFDIYPRLEATPENKKTYQHFLDDILKAYRGVCDEKGIRSDHRVLLMPTHHNPHITLMVGGCPYVPSNPERCDYFLRFSSMVGEPLTAPAKPYIDAVYKIARKHFGSRVYFWSENNETADERQWGCYACSEVNKAEAKFRELERVDLANHERERERRTMEMLRQLPLPEFLFR